MSGICGIIHTDGTPVQESTLEQMIAAIRHRGPDGQTMHIDGATALGHCRLETLASSENGMQTLCTADQRHCITYNGMLYNCQELRAELQSLGHFFTTSSDTEVVLRAYIQWGPRCLPRFNGAFALGILDYTQNILFLARDRYGSRPLYYALMGKHFLFASEHKAFIQHPAFTPHLDREALLEYFTFQNILSTKTFFEGVSTFPPGSYGIFQLDGNGKLCIHQYWDFNFSEDSNITNFHECQEEVYRLFSRAVDRHMGSGVEVGTHLSGGIDSSSITALAARNIPYIKSFTCGFDLHSASGLELSYDERKAAELMSYLFKTEHYEMVLKAGDMERVLPAVIWHIEEPRVGQSYPNYCIANLASRFVKVCLAGAGGDELFGGYPWRYYRTVGATTFDDYINRYYQFWQRLVPDQDLPRVLGPIWGNVKDISTRSIFLNIFGDNKEPPATPQECVNRSLYFEAKTFLHGLLTVEDKLAMAHGLEIRTPFLDNDLVDFAQKIPVHFKLNKLNEVARINENDPAKMKYYYTDSSDGKQILRHTMRRLIPAQVTEALKQGFSAPDASWFRGESIEYVKRMLYSPECRLYDYMDRQAVQKLVQDHFDGRANRRLFIWSLLSFELWLRLYLP